MILDSRFFRIACLVLIMLASGLVLRRWVLEDERTLAWDQSIHTKVSFIYKDRVSTDGLASLLKPAYFNYPPLYHLSLVPFLNKTKDVADAGSFVNFFYLCILLVLIYLIGVELMGVKEGLTAAFLFSTYPLAFDLTTQTMIDLSLTMWVAAGVYCLLKSEGFSNRVWSVGFGVVLGLGMLTKWTALAYLLGPIFIEIMPAFRKKKMGNLFFALLVAFIVMAPWYLSNLVPMLSRVAKVSGLPPASGYKMSGVANAFWYPLSLFEQIGFFYVLVFLPGLIAFIWKPKLKTPLIWFIVSIVLFTLIRNRNTRYFLPVLPAVALLTVSWLPSARKIPFVAFNAAVALFFIVFHFFPAKTVYLKSGAFPVPVLPYRAPVGGDWKHLDIIHRVQELKPSDRDWVRILTVSNAPHLHSTTLNISLKSKNIKDLVFDGPSKKRWFEFMDFVLLKTGDLGPPFTIKTIQECADVIRDSSSWFFDVYKEAGRWPLPDGSEAILYQKFPTPIRNLNVAMLNISLDQLEMPNVTAKGVKIQTIPFDNEKTSRGILRKLSIQCQSVSYKTLSFDEVRLTMVQPQVNLPLFLESQDLQMLSLGKMQLNAVISPESLVAYAAKKAKWLKSPSIFFEGKTVSLSGKAGGVPLFIQFNVWIENYNLNTNLLKLNVAGIPIPSFFLRSLTDRRFSLKKGMERSYDLDIREIYGQENKLHIR